MLIIRTHVIYFYSMIEAGVGESIHSPDLSANESTIISKPDEPVEAYTLLGPILQVDTFNVNHHHNNLRLELISWYSFNFMHQRQQNSLYTNRWQILRR